MTPFKLSDQQRLELEYIGSHTPWAKERCRAQALLWLDEGASVEQTMSYAESEIEGYLRT